MERIRIGVIGLGYVGLPLARLLATKYNVVGFDINQSRVDQLSKGIDTTLEIEREHLLSVLVKDVDLDKGLFCTSNKEDLKRCNYYIITVPTPVDKNKQPNLKPLLKATKSVGSVLDKGNIVIYESTVYPGATEEACVPILEEKSNLIFNKDFYVGYSPERINPGDKRYTIEKILKVTSGSTIEAAQKIDDLYNSVIEAGTYLAPSIKVAEAAKVIENAQRDINIAFVNELSKIFNLMGINTQEVLKTASTKWNFLPFTPGLVGGHCIGVDPYYLAQKAQELGYHPEIIITGRRLNDGMSAYVATQLIKTMIKNEIPIKDSKVLILGVTFKENCPDYRNTKVVDLVKSLQDYGVHITIYDPWVNIDLFKKDYDLDIISELPDTRFEAILLAVSHDLFQNLDLSLLKKNNSVVYDVKGFFTREKITASL